MKTIYTAIPLAVLAAIAQGHEHGDTHDAGVHDFLGDNSEKGDFLGDTYQHDLLGDGHNVPHKEPAPHGPAPEIGPNGGTLNIPPDGPADFPAVPSFDTDSFAANINSPSFNSPTIAPDINSPISGPHNFNKQKGPHTHSGDNEVEDGINNDNIVITPVTSFQGQIASEQDDYESQPPPPPPFPHGGPPHGGPPHGGPGGPPHHEGGEHGPEQIPAGQHSEPQHQVPGPPGGAPHQGADPGPEHHGAEPAPPANRGSESQGSSESHQGEFEGEHAEPGHEHENHVSCTSHGHEESHPQTRLELASGREAKPTPGPDAEPAPKPQFDQGQPKPLGQIPSSERGQGEAYQPGVHISDVAYSSSARVYNARPSAAHHHASYRLEAHSTFAARASHTPTTTPTVRVDASTGAHKPDSTATSVFVGGAGSVSAPQGIAMAVAGALAFLL